MKIGRIDEKGESTMYRWSRSLEIVPGSKNALYRPRNGQKRRKMRVLATPV
jgi:hypothetical protein